MISWKRIGLKDYEFPTINSYKKEYLNPKEQTRKYISLGKSSKDTLPSLNYKQDTQGLGREFMVNIEESRNAGIHLHIPENTKVEESIRLNFNLDKDNPTLVDYNNIYAEANSQVTVLIDYNSSNEVEGFHNGFTNIFAGKGSKVNIIKLQRLNYKTLNFDFNFSKIESDAEVNFVSIELGSRLSGFNYTSVLEEDISNSNLSSIYLADKDMNLDLEYTMVHKGVRSHSNIDTKGALMGNAKKVFRGNLDFKRGSRVSKGVEREEVLLLSPDVNSDSIPALLCEEDNVEGEHAVSAGQIDNSKLFYLMSRGLSELEAKKLIVESSFNPIIDMIPFDDLKDEVRLEIERRLVNE